LERRHGDHADKDGGNGVSHIRQANTHTCLPEAERP
jgi:hypothetical protein